MAKFKKFFSDRLAIMTDDDVFKINDMLSHLLNVRNSKNQFVSDLEIELCYVQRELGIRKIRNKVHKNYLKKSLKDEILFKMAM